LGRINEAAYSLERNLVIKVAGYHPQSKMKKVLNRLLRNILRSALGLLIPAALHAQTIRIDGSSTVYPISKKAANDFQNLMQGAI
jgi:ABC-type phosphate transport system substrate-binding protein